VTALQTGLEPGDPISESLRTPIVLFDRKCGPMSRFKRRRRALDPLVIVPFEVELGEPPEDNMPGAEAAGLEAIARSAGARGTRPYTPSGESIAPVEASVIDPRSVIPKVESPDSRDSN
jgi:hypothetical protein